MSIHTINTFVEKYIQYIFLLLAFVIPINYKVSYKVLVITLILWLLTSNYKKLCILLKENFYVQLFSIFVFYSISSYFWSDNQDLFYSYMKNFLFYLYIPFLLIISSIKKEYIPKMISAFLFGMIFNEIVSYGIFFDLWATSRGTMSNPVPFVSSHMEYSVLMALSVLLLAYKLFHKISFYERLIYTFFSITMSINLFLSTGRTGQLSLLFASLILLIIYFRKKIKYLLIVFSILLATFYLAYLAKGSFYNRINQTIKNVSSFVINQNVYSSIGVRLSSYLIIKDIFLEQNKIIGQSLTGAPIIVNKHQISKFGTGTTFDHQEGHLHNGYLTVLVALGLVGLSLFLFLFYKLLSTKIKDHNINYIKYSSILIIIFSNLAENMFRQKEILLLFALFTAIIISQKIFENQLQRE